MTLEERKADHDWQELSVIERLAALGMLRDTDGSVITLEEEYKWRSMTDEEKAAIIDKQREKIKKKIEERRKIRRECQKKLNEEIEELLK